MLSLIVLRLFSGNVLRANERILGELFPPAADKSEKLELLMENSAEPTAPAIISLRFSRDGEKGGKQSYQLALKTERLPGTKGTRADMPFEAHVLAMPVGSQAFWIDFGVEDEPGATRAICVLLVKAGDTQPQWRIANEWSADCGPLGEMGFKRAKHSFSSSREGVLERQSRSLMVEGILHKLDCGCNACQSRTIEMTGNEVYTWDGSSHAFERTSYEKRYVVQPGEGLMSVARKALGDARLLARIYKLNPELKADGMLKEGQQIVVERK